MRKGIFSKLAVQNIRNNKSTYIPYMITCIFCIAMIYMMEFLRDCPTLDQAVRHAAEVRMILSTGEVVVVIFCVIFLIYSNSFLMKRGRKKSDFTIFLDWKEIISALYCYWKRFLQRSFPSLVESQSESLPVNCHFSFF